LLAAVNEEVHFFISHVGMLADKLSVPTTMLSVIIVPRIFVSEKSYARLSQELGNSDSLLDMKGGKEMAGYFIDQLHTQLDETLVQLVYKRKIVPTGDNWFIIDVDPSFEWENNKSPLGHFVVAKPFSSEKMDRATLAEAKQQEARILANFGKMSRSEIDDLMAQWRSKIQ
jgi:hypothetical protein